MDAQVGQLVAGQWSRRQWIQATGALVAGTPWMARAQGGPIRIGSTVALSGVEQPNGESLMQGAQACFNAINRAGGINGRQIEMVMADDGFNGRGHSRQTTGRSVGVERVHSPSCLRP